MDMIRIASILPNSLNVNGPGLRYVIFAQGCNHKCNGCFNQHTWDTDEGILKPIDVIIDEIEKNKLITGVTFSGGDPLLQAKNFGTLARYIKAIKGRKIDIWCYTGFEFEQLIQRAWFPVFDDLLSKIDVLVDGRFEQNNIFTDEDIRHITELKRLGQEFNPYRGSKNQRVLDVKKSIKKKRAIEIPKYSIN